MQAVELGIGGCEHLILPLEFVVDHDNIVFSDILVDHILDGFSALVLWRGMHLDDSVGWLNRRKVRHIDVEESLVVGHKSVELVQVLKFVGSRESDDGSELTDSHESRDNLEFGVSVGGDAVCHFIEDRLIHLINQEDGIQRNPSNKALDITVVDMASLELFWHAS